MQKLGFPETENIGDYLVEAKMMLEQMYAEAERQQVAYALGEGNAVPGSCEQADINQLIQMQYGLMNECVAEVLRELPVRGWRNDNKPSIDEIKNLLLEELADEFLFVLASAIRMRATYEEFAQCIANKQAKNKVRAEHLQGKAIDKSANSDYHRISAQIIGGFW